MLFLQLDSFSDGGQAQSTRKLHLGVRDGEVLPRVTDILCERLVELEEVTGQYP